MEKKKQNDGKESAKASQRQQYTSIEHYQSNPNQRIKITSPKSVKAMRQLGYSQEDFHCLSFKEFIKNNHDIRQLSPSIQTKRYECFEQLRLAKIKQVAELRETIDINQINNSSIKANSVQTDNALFSETEVKSTAVAEEIKAFERIKRKNEADLINMVEYELKKQIMHKEAENKMRKQQFKLTQFQKQVELSRDQAGLLQKNCQEQKEMNEREKEERQRQLNAIKYNEEQQRLQKLKKEEEMKLELNKLKHEEDEKKRIAFQQKVDSMIEEKIIKANERREQMNQRDEERQISLEKRRQQLMFESNEKARLKQELIQRNMNNANEHLENVRRKYLMKQKENELKKERLDKERENELKQKQEETRLRAEKTKNVIEKDKEIQKKKLDDYNVKQQLIAMKKRIIDKDKKKEQEEHRRAIEEKELNRLNTIAKNEELLNQKKMMIFEKIMHKESMISECRKKKEQELMEKAEEANRRRLLSQSNIRREEIMKQNKREDTLNWILYKSTKIQLYKEQKEMISDKKRQLKDSITRKKEEYEDKFQIIFHKKEIDNKTIETILQMFPGNERINTLLKRLDEIEKENIEQSQIEQEYAETLHKTLTEFKKSLCNSSNNNTLGQTQTGKKWISKGSIGTSNEGLKQEVSIQSNKDKEGNIVKIKIQTQAQPRSTRTKSKSVGRQQVENKSKNHISTMKTNQTLSSTKNNKEKLCHSENFREFTFKQRNNDNKNNKSSNTIGNDKWNQTAKTMQSSSHLKSHINEEKEIKRKINKYKLNLSNELIALISKEKLMEQKRVEQYIQCQGAQKEELKRKIGEERALSSLRIIDKNKYDVNILYNFI